MGKTDSETTLQELKALITEFTAERGWNEYHKPKNLAMSIAIEAAELMEHFQWDDLPDHKTDAEQKQKIADELADVLIYCFEFANKTGIDISSSFRQKIQKATHKYPVKHFNPDSQDRKKYHEIKRTYRRGRK